jgi:hypothetical protein
MAEYGEGPIGVVLAGTHREGDVLWLDHTPGCIHIWRPWHSTGEPCGYVDEHARTDRADDQGRDIYEFTRRQFVAGLETRGPVS